MNWRTVLVEWPAKLFTAWWTVYGIIWTVLFMVVGTMTLIVLVLYAFGIRWGW